MASDAWSNSTSTIEVIVETQPIIAALAGGGVREAGVDAKLRLDASASTDPDDANSTWHFAWSCLNLTTPAAPLACVDADGVDLALMISGVDNVSLSLPARTLAPHAFGYTFTVLATKDTRNASASQRVIVKPGDPPVVSLPGLTDEYVNPNNGDDGAYLVLEASARARLPSFSKRVSPRCRTPVSREGRRAAHWSAG